MPSHSPTPQTGRIWVVDAHPSKDSFCSALASRFAEGAREAGHTVRFTKLRDLQFDYNARQQALEPDLSTAQQDLIWCVHLVLVYPNWWGTYPALLKAWFDRILLPGFAFRVEKSGWTGLLAGRSAQIVTTMDTPFWVYRWILGSPGTRAVQRATLGFCGIKPVKIKLVGPVHSSSHDMRKVWLEEIHQMGLSVSQQIQGSRNPPLDAWVAAARLQFYPFPLLALVTGAMGAAVTRGSPVLLIPLLLAGACAVLLELVTVLTNEIEDQATDLHNGNAGHFTGGSRVLVKGLLSEDQVRTGRRAAAALLALITLLLVLRAPDGAGAVAGLILLGLTLGHQYSATPLRLSYRGWGEVTVAFTHSALVVGLGWASQAGSEGIAGMWGISMGIFMAVLPSIILAGFPDEEADRISGKRTLVVQGGRAIMLYAAITATAVAMLFKVAFSSGGSLSPGFNAATLVHGMALALGMWRYSYRPRAGKIDGLLVLALTFMLWFALEPFCAYWAVVYGWQW